MSISIAALPPLAWTGRDGQAEYDAPSGELTLRARKGVDWTNDATGGPVQHEATALAFDAPAGDFVLSARVRVRGERGTFDAGALALWSDTAHWAKLCNEYSPQGEAMVVSVVTNDVSDDANGPLLDADAIFLRTARVGKAFAFHFSRDGLAWHFVRVFRLSTPAPPGGRVPRPGAPRRRGDGGVRSDHLRDDVIDGSAGSELTARREPGRARAMSDEDRPQRTRRTVSFIGPNDDCAPSGTNRFRR